ncbi:hypothetical protein BH18ACI1_BH18ACI1_00490 [soil metagenome]
MDDSRQPPSTNGNGHEKGFLIIGLGASAGGIKALKEFFQQVPADSGMAYVVILHLSPEHDSLLAEILQQSASIPVTQVQEEKVKVVPNHVYVIPPNKSLKMNDGHLALSDVTRIEERRAPIDIFFRTLAESHESRAAVVILSGTGADGSMGMKRVKEKGGVVFVQDPNEAEYTDMPRNSLATGLVDFVLPAAEMPARIIGYRENLGKVTISPELRGRPETDERALRDIFTQLRIRTGHDFSNYKRATVLRRIERRVNVHELKSIQDYSRLLHEQPSEASALLRDLLISVTNFFRDSETFNQFERRIIARLFENKTANDTVRVWVAGCATGEEAYSLAMLTVEYAENLRDAPAIQIFATDIDESAIAIAREGFYTATDTADVSPERLRRFFVAEPNGYRVRRDLRERVLFAIHNVIKDPPFSHLNLVLCRNLLIYLNRAAQKRAMEIFHFSLNAGGFLFLGTSESADVAVELFAVSDKEHHIYQSRNVNARVSLPISDLMLPRTDLQPTRPAEMRRIEEANALERMAYTDLHQRLLEKYAQPSIIVSENYDILHLTPRAGKYLAVAGGEPSYNLLKIIHPNLRLALRTALYQAVQTAASVETRGLEIQIGDEKIQKINLVVRPVLREGADVPRGFLLVLFEEANEANDAKTAVRLISLDEPARQLEAELVHLHEQLHTTVDQYETQTEELDTVNKELKIKIEELSQSNDDFLNLIASTDIGTLFLDRSLRIKLFTPRLLDIYNLRPADICRPISDITTKLSDSDLHAEAEKGLASLQSIEREVTTSEGRVYLTSILPYRTADNRIDGVIATFLDITTRKRHGKELEEIAERLERQTRIFDTTLSAISDFAYLFDRDGRFVFANQPLFDLLGITAEEIVGKNFHDLNYPPDLAVLLQKQIQHFFDTGEMVKDETPFTNLAGENGFYEYILTPVFAKGGTVEFVAGSTRDVTIRKQSEEKLRQSEERLRLLIESAKDYAIIGISAENCLIEFWNTGAERIFGWTESEIIGEHCEILFMPEDRAVNVPEKETKTAREKGFAEDERFHIRKDESRFYASGVMRALADEGGNLLGFVKIARDMTEKTQAEAALRLAHESLEIKVQLRTVELAEANSTLQAEIAERQQIEQQRLTLLKKLVTSQEDERQRISRELHDHLGQQLTALRLNLEMLQKDCADNADLCEKITRTQKIAEQVDSDLDFLAWELRPAALKDLGLTTALNDYIKEWSIHFDIPAEFHTSGLETIALEMAIELNFYRIVQEALNNTGKYARANQASVLLECRGKEIMLIIEDDGQGFDIKKATTLKNGKGLGLIGMRERAALIGGTLEIESVINQGTTIFVRVPLGAQTAGG